MSDQNIMTRWRRFAVGFFTALVVFTVAVFATQGVVEASSLTASQPLQLAQKTTLSPGALLRQCKSKCERSYNSCVAGGCSPGSAPDGRCTRAEAVAGCMDKYGARKATCLANCDQ